METIMKPATRAPFYACMYPGMCDVARQHGYALALHGSMVSDLDLCAIPWTPEAVEPEVLVKALFDYLGAVEYRAMLKRDNDFLTEAQLDQLCAGERKPEKKPHGRLAWNLWMFNASRVDLSVMPRAGVPASPVFDKPLNCHE